MTDSRNMKIGLTEKHGMVKEYSLFPPEGVEYSFLTPQSGASKILHSPMKGYFRQFESDEHDLIEATLCPIFTNNNWIYSIANFQEALAFNFCGAPVPRPIRVAYIKHLFLKDNFKKLVFWSEAGRKTLATYGKVTDRRILDKSAVVYPAIRKVADELINYNTHSVNLLFSGDFFRKGGVNVVDVFEIIQRKHPEVSLILCCDEKLDFITDNTALKNKYLKKIKSNVAINFRGRVSRDEMINNILPQTDIYLLPTYVEAFGYAILEAMAYGIPIIATNVFAIPEMIEHEKSGFLIDVSSYDCEKMFKGYVVTDIPQDFKKYVTDKLFNYVNILVSNPELRRKFGYFGLGSARKKFSFEIRNCSISKIYFG